MALKIRSERPIHEIVYTDGEDSAKFFCRVLTSHEVAKMAEKSTRYVWDAPKKRAPKQRFEQLDMARFIAEKVDEVIVGWEGILNSDGSELECNRENKLLLETMNPEIISFVLDEIDAITDAEQKLEKGELGNSDASQIGSSEEM